MGIYANKDEARLTARELLGDFPVRPCDALFAEVVVHVMVVPNTEEMTARDLANAAVEAVRNAVRQGEKTGLRHRLEGREFSNRKVQISIPNSPAICRTKERCFSGTRACHSARYSLNVPRVSSSSHSIASQQSGFCSNKGSKATATTLFLSCRVGSCWSIASFSANHWARVVPGGTGRSWSSRRHAGVWRGPRPPAWIRWSNPPGFRHPPHGDDGGDVGDRLCEPLVRSSGVVFVDLLDGAARTRPDRRPELPLRPLRQDIGCFLVVGLHAVCMLGRGGFVVRRMLLGAAMSPPTCFPSKSKPLSMRSGLMSRKFSNSAAGGLRRTWRSHGCDWRRVK